MKTKKIFAALLMAAVCLGVSSCSDPDPLAGGMRMTEQNRIDKGIEFAGQDIGENDIITEVVFTPVKNVGVTKRADNITFCVYPEGEDAMKKIDVYPNTNKNELKETKVGDPSSSQKKSKKETGIAFKDIDFSRIAEYVNEAGSTVASFDEDSEEGIFFSGVGVYKITVNNDPKKFKHEFTIESKDTAKSTRMRDHYYEFKFRVDGEGNLSGPLEK